MIGEHQTLDEWSRDRSRYSSVNVIHYHMQTVAKIKTTHKGLTVQLKPPFNLN